MVALIPTLRNQSNRLEKGMTEAAVRKENKCQLQTG
jgi:hypothetical protein